jgi:hypothetical protein
LLLARFAHIYAFACIHHRPSCRLIIWQPRPRLEPTHARVRVSLILPAYQWSVMYSMLSNQRVYHTYKKSLASATDHSLLKFIIGADGADAMTRSNVVIYAHMCMHDDHELVVRHAWMHTPSPYLRGWSRNIIIRYS